MGEKNELKEAHPKVVKRLDRMIEAHIQDADAVVPLPNPDFDPKEYRPEHIGLTPTQVKALESKSKKNR